MRLNVDHLLIQALQEDITSEDVSTNAVMPSYQYGQVQLICKEDGIIAGLEVFERVFYLLDESMEVKFYVKDGDAVKTDNYWPKFLEMFVFFYLVKGRL